jgi:hypothetical protein
MIADGISLNDFKSWLQGVEDMQEAEWTPNASQWNKIRQKIESIVESLPKTNLHPQGPIPRASVMNRIEEHEYVPVPAPTPMPSSIVPRGVTNNTSFTLPPPPSHLLNPKTPDIDTSTGSYTTNYV